MRPRAGILVIAGLGAALALAGIGSAGATEKLNSFAGSCSVQGEVTFNPPVTNTEQPLAVDYQASGTCSGTLDGQNVSDAAVKLHHSGHSQGSCLGARTTAPGHGTITFPDGTVIPYTFEFQATGTEVDFTLSGQRAGTGKGHGTFLNSRTPPDAALNCSGRGDATLPMDMSLTTDGPFVSGAGGGKGHKQRKRKHRHHKHKHPAKRAVQTFQGSCDFAGTVHFDPALTLLAQPTTVTAEAPGQCSGTLSSNGAAWQLNQARALYWARSTGRQSCGSNPGSTGGGYLLIADSRIDFAMVETRIGPNGHLELSGAGGGSMAASLSASGDPLATVASCAQSGVAESPLTISAESESGISG